MPAWRKYDAAVPAVVERRRPARSGTLESDFVVPLAQSVVTGVLGAILTAVIAAVAGASRPAVVGAVVGGVVLAGVWLLALSDRRRLLWEIERVSNLDLDRDGQTGPPVRPPVTTVELVDRKRKRIRYLDLPLDDQQLEELAREVLKPGGKFNRQSVARVMSNDVYQIVIERLLDGGLLRTRGEGVTTGVELTPSGRAWLRRYT